MAKLAKISLILLALAIVACSAEPPKYRQVRRFQQQKQRTVQLQPRRKLARQQEEAAVTPYPTADELKPEVAFEEGNTPDEVYGPPDQTYGPPEVEQVPADQLPSEDAPEDFAPNPDAEEFQSSEVEAEQPEQPSRLTSRRKAAKKIVPSRLTQKKKTQKSQRLVVAPAVAAPAVPVAAVPLATTFPASSQQYFVVNQPFGYSAQYQIW